MADPLSGATVRATIAPMHDAVAQYLQALDEQDWASLRGTLTDEDFERIGPFCDVVASSDEYAAFLERVVSPLGEYGVRVRRHVEGDGLVYAEVTESFLLDGTKAEFPEVLVFDTRDGRISRVQVYMMRPGGEPPVAGARS